MKHYPVQPITTPISELHDHSPIGFSGWERHSNCHGSVALATISPPGRSSPQADQGNIAHGGGAYWILNGRAQSGMDTDMENFVRHYVYSIWDHLPKTHVAGSLWMVEGRVAAPLVHPDCRGTVDVLIWDKSTGVLQVHDLKYGKHPVSAENNKQLMGYAMCARHTYPQIRPKRIELYIHQVRLSPEPDMWACDDMDLDLFEEEVVEHIAAIEQQKKLFATTKDPRKLDLHAGDWCTFCPAKFNCHEREDAAKREGIDVLMPVPDILPPDAGKLVAFARAALPWAQAVLKAAKDHAVRGGVVPGHKLVAGKRSKRYIASDEDIAEELMFEKDLGGLGLAPSEVYGKPKLQSPTQILAAIPKNAKEAQRAFGELWKWAPGAPQLVVDSDSRPSLRVRPEDYFSMIEDDEEEEPNEDY